jgi:HK97 family phage prohead protease
MKGTKSVILTFSGNIEAVDSGERRTISGKIAPYGEIGYTSAGKVVFAEGSISAAEPSKVKLLMAHDNSAVVGRMQSMTSAKDGLYASFKVSASSRGSDAILLAQEQLMDGLSVGVEVTASKPEKDYLLVTAATLREVSLVESAAFASAAVQKIAAAASDMLVTPVEAASTKVTTTHIVTTETETETETQPESEAAVTTAPDQNAPEAVDATEQAAPTVEAARKIILPSALNSQRVRTPIVSMSTYTEHKIKAALGSDESKLYVTAADDSFATNPAFNPTQYLSEFVTNTRFPRSAIDACSRGVLPPTGTTINVPSLVDSNGGLNGVAPTVTVEAEAGAVSDTGMVTEYLTGTVSKYSGMNTLSVELLERTNDPNFYNELTNQLQVAYMNATDQAVITAINATGFTSTGVAATAAGLISYTAESTANVYKNSGYFAQNFVGSTGIYNLLLGAVDTTGRPIFNAYQPNPSSLANAGGMVSNNSVRGNMLGLDLYVDRFMTAGVADNSAFILAPEAFTVYESPQAYMSVNVVSNLQVQIAIYGFMATIAKIPHGICRLNIS